MYLSKFAYPDEGALRSFAPVEGADRRTSLHAAWPAYQPIRLVAPPGRVWEGWSQTRFQSVYTFEGPAKLVLAPPSSTMDPVNVTLLVRTKITPRGSAWFDLVCSLHIHQCSRCRFRTFPSHSLLIPVTRLAPSPTLWWPTTVYDHMDG